MINVSNINSILNDFLTPFECSADISTDFEYLYAESKIHYALVVSEKSNRLFLNDVERRFPTIHADIFLWSFLHELGHHMTMDDMEDEEVAESENIKNYLDTVNLTDKEKYNLYFNAPDEKLATEWAADYMLAHSEEINNLWVALKAAIADFYVSNGVNINE